MQENVVPLPFVTLGGVTGSHESQFETTPPSSGSVDHQYTLQWMDTFGQEAEMSTSLVATKPNSIEYNTQLEVSGIFYPAEDCAL